VSAPEEAPSAPPADAARAFLEAEVDAALAPYRASMPAEQLAWVREQLLEGAVDADGLAALVRAAVPRAVDDSGEVFYSLKPRP